MRRLLPLALAMLMILPASVTAEQPLIVAGAGEAHHEIVYTRGNLHATVYRTLHGETACAGDGLVYLHVDYARDRLLLVTGDDACVPGFADVGGCAAPDAEGTILCERVVGSDAIRLTLGADGAFLFTWDGAGFRERVEGRVTLVRA